MINKSFMTNFIAFLIFILSFLLEDPLKAFIFNIGIFALSGAVTNWLAVHMLFEKVPFLYGSGVIPARFEDFKKGIYNLIMNEFFTIENIKNFTSKDTKDININFNNILSKIDFSSIFDALLKTITSSPLGGILSSFLQPETIKPFKDSFIEKIKSKILDILKSEEFKKTISQEIGSFSSSDAILDKVKVIIQKRLDELTPAMVKEIIQDMIRKHLGWLVVWGGVFGGFIGFLTSFLN